ncbi:MAG: hypothetical protein ACRC62_17285 [Microcoleus sp.]
MSNPLVPGTLDYRVTKFFMPYDNYQGPTQNGNNNPTVKAAADRRKAAENDVPVPYIKPAEKAGARFGKNAHVSID